MQAAAKNVWDLFEQGQFRIPLYQRHYDWKDEQCQALWEDFIRLHAVPGSTHYLGTMVVEEREGVFQIVDGQQRTTSLMLLLKAFGDALPEDERALLRALSQQRVTTCSLFLEALRRELGDEPLTRHLRNGEHLKLSFEDQVDQRTYRHLMLGHFCDPESLSENMRGNFRYFCEEVRARTDTWRGYLIDGLLNRLLFVRVTLPANLPPQRVFERMNSARLPPSQADMIKNYLLMVTPEPGEQEVVYQQLEKHLANPDGRHIWGWWVRLLVSMHEHREVEERNVYKSFKRFYEAPPIGWENAEHFLQLFDGWTKQF